MEKTYNYIFHYNHYTGLWNAIPRDLYNDYWNGSDIKGVLKSKDINTLVDNINKEVKKELLKG